MSRNNTAYVSDYTRDRVHVSRLVRGETRTLTANFNALLAEANTIASVTWRTQGGYPILMATPAISGKTATVKVTAQNGGVGILKCQATTSKNMVLTQLFRMEVEGAPYFNGEVNPPVDQQILTIP